MFLICPRTKTISEKLFMNLEQLKTKIEQRAYGSGNAVDLHIGRLDGYFCLEELEEICKYYRQQRIKKQTTKGDIALLLI